MAGAKWHLIYIAFENGCLQQKNLPSLEKNVSYIFGRSESCYVRLEHDRIAEHHARLLLANDCLMLKDLKSANGTFVNGKKLPCEGSQKLENGDQFSLHDNPQERGAGLFVVSREVLNIINVFNISGQGQVNFNKVESQKVKVESPGIHDRYLSPDQEQGGGAPLDLAGIDTLPDSFKEVGTTPGGMSKVIFYYNSDLRRLLACKEPIEDHNHPERENRQGQLIVREARLLEKLFHPRIVGFHRLYRRDKYPLLLMDFISGPNLEDFMKKNGDCSLRERVQYASQMADTLVYLHLEMVCHRDIKPANVLLGEDGIMLIDFNIARDAGQTLTKYTNAPGTPGYMAPEVSNGMDSQGKRMERFVFYSRGDCYGLGATLYYLLASKPPWGENWRIIFYEYLQSKGQDRENNRKKYEKQVEEELAALGIDPYLRCVCARQMGFDPDLRPTAETLARSLKLWLVLEKVLPTEKEWAKKEWEWAKKEWEKIAKAVLLDAADGFDLAQLDDRWKEEIVNQAVKSEIPGWDGAVRSFESTPPDRRKDGTFLVPGSIEQEKAVLAEITPEVMWAGEILCPAQGIVCGGDFRQIAAKLDSYASKPEEYHQGLKCLVEGKHKKAAAYFQQTSKSTSYPALRVIADSMARIIDDGLSARENLQKQFDQLQSDQETLQNDATEAKNEAKGLREQLAEMYGRINNVVENWVE